ncbi:MAG: hypothetical protein J3K34DRAFT_435795 [Monoraphidium minutum]|nr:MAG: hypothetical protein J3K34DRAFT_435795 [Monoraphidium minutum]
MPGWRAARAFALRPRPPAVMNLWAAGMRRSAGPPGPRRPRRGGDECGDECAVTGVDSYVCISTSFLLQASGLSLLGVFAPSKWLRVVSGSCLRPALAMGALGRVNRVWARGVPLSLPRPLVRRRPSRAQLWGAAGARAAHGSAIGGRSEKGPSRASPERRKRVERQRRAAAFGGARGRQDCSPPR